MQLASHVKSALTNLVTLKLRSFLTMLGVLVGTASVVALVSSGQLATANALAQFKSLGTDLLSVSVQENSNNPASNSSSASQNHLSLTNIEEIKEKVSGIQAVAPYTTDYSTVYYNGTNITAYAIGSTQHLQKIIKIQLKEGRFISFLDQYASYAVIGDSVAKALKNQGVFEPLGKQILVGSTYFTIIGVAKPWPSNIFIPEDINQTIIIPISTSFLLSKYVQIRNIIFLLDKNINIDNVQNEIQSTVKLLAPEEQLYFQSPKQLIQSMEKQRQILTLLLALIGSISLIVGGIGVMNIMLVSVIERRREIGIRMAIGAKRRDIEWMFLTEAVMLTVLGGIIGIILGELISFITALASGWSFQLFLLPPIVGFLVSFLVGVFFGFYPARKASRLNPIETLRSD